MLKSPLTQILASVLLGILISFTATGCIALAVGAAGVGGYAFYKGELKSTESATLDRLWRATRSAAQELQLVVTEERKDGLSAELNAQGADGKPISVNLRRVADQATELRIRVGHLGSESQARQIREAIERQL